MKRAISDADRIKAARAKLGMSQTEFAEALGLTRKQTVSDWERGKKEPAPYLWLALKWLTSKAAL